MEGFLPVPNLNLAFFSIKIFLLVQSLHEGQGTPPHSALLEPLYRLESAERSSWYLPFSRLNSSNSLCPSSQERYPIPLSILVASSGLTAPAPCPSCVGWLLRVRGWEWLLPTQSGPPEFHLVTKVEQKLRKHLSSSLAIRVVHPCITAQPVTSKKGLPTFKFTLTLILAHE